MQIFAALIAIVLFVIARYASWHNDQLWAKIYLWSFLAFFVFGIVHLMVTSWGSEVNNSVKKTVYVCDVCGGQSSEDGHVIEVGKGERSPGRPYRRYDLCPECFKKIQEVLKSRK